MVKRVLFVDDDEMWRKSVSASFAAAGVDLVAASDASEAMALAETGPLSLIILDLNLEGESGAMLLKFLKHNHAGVPILLYTGVEHDEAEVQRLLQMGADQYLTKSSVEELLVVASSYL
jgi:DNA-binding response OmpR family regulator